MIDLRSDTVTKPSAAMRQAMAEAEVGDDVYGEDPSVNRLQDYVAKLLGKEAALFVPSGTMANLVAFLAQTRPGETVILGEGAHPYHYENANLAMVGGLLTRTIADPLGKMTADQVAAQILQIDDAHISPTTLVAIENTTNRGGGACYGLDEIEKIGRLCRNRGLRLHCDGARLFNAAAATNVEAEYLAAPCDTVCCCLSKGLGAPVGSVVAGSRETIHRAHRFRKMLGGGMRQAGILAAAGLYALEHHRADLHADHRRAGVFRRRLEDRGVEFLYPSPTNIVCFRAEEALRVVSEAADRGVLALPLGTDTIRAVFHRDTDDDGLDQAAGVFTQALGG